MKRAQALMTVLAPWVPVDGERYSFLSTMMDLRLVVTWESLVQRFYYAGFENELATLNTGSSVTADGSGAYAIPGLANGVYAITPELANYTFSPATISATVSGSDLTGQNFVASSAGTTYQVRDNFIRPDGSLGPNWTPAFQSINMDTVTGRGGLQTSSHAWSGISSDGSDSWPSM